MSSPAKIPAPNVTTGPDACPEWCNLRNPCPECVLEAKEPPAGAYVHPQDDAHKMRVGRYERKRRRGRGISAADIEAAVEREVKGRSKL